MPHHSRFVQCKCPCVCQPDAVTPTFSFAPVSDQPFPFSGLTLARARLSRIGGMVLAVLLHLLLLWLVLSHETLVLKPPAAGSDEGTITYVAPLASAQQKAPPPPVPPAVQKPVVPRAKPPVLARRAPPKAVPPTRRPPAANTASTATVPLTPAPNTAAQADTANAAPTEDFSARIDAARRRRAAAQAQDPALAAAPSESESERANRIARENIAFQQHGQGGAQDQTGGVFQLKGVRQHNAEFLFRGWNQNFRRNWSQMVEVEQGNEIDIENAIIKRMILLIRSHKPGDFVWDSHRLGHPVTLNASVASEPELRAFLLKEFFPNYIRGSAQ